MSGEGLRSTAEHEAGHTVMSRRVAPWRHDGPASVEADHDAGTAGRAYVEGISNDTAELAAEDILISLAGYAALAAQDRAHPDLGCESDFDSAQRLVEGWSLGTLDE